VFTELVLRYEHLVTVFCSLDGIEWNKLSIWMATKGIKLDHATVMAMRRSKSLNGWQWGKSKIFDGNEKIGIDFSGNKAILSLFFQRILYDFAYRSAPVWLLRCWSEAARTGGDAPPNGFKINSSRWKPPIDYISPTPTHVIMFSGVNRAARAILYASRRQRSRRPGHGVRRVPAATRSVRRLRTSRQPRRLARSALPPR
jgi:hypothetical protein